MDTARAATLQPKRWRHARTDALIAAAALSSLVFIALIGVPALSAGRIERHVGHVPVLVGHITGGAIMLIAGAVALRIGLTREWFRWHRVAGYTYLAAGMIASVSALIRSLDAKHTPGLATAALAAVWISLSAMAFRAIRNRRIEQHRDWMIRSYVAAWTFVFCRFYSRVMPDVLQGDESDMIWATWIGPLIICEICLQWRRGSATRTG